jgi:hypothetical protein
MRERFQTANRHEFTLENRGGFRLQHVLSTPGADHRDAKPFRSPHSALCNFCLLVLFIICFALADARGNEVIADPIADYLAMNVPDRVENAGRLLVLKRVEVDMEGNGTPVVFIGTWYRKSGPNTWLWIAYAPVAEGFQRITDSDVLVDFADIYVGPIPALHRNGLVQAYSLELDNQDRDQSNMISDLEYYFVDNGKLVQQGAGPLDREDPDQKATFDFFFGPKRTVSSIPKITSYSVGELAQRGYHLPGWAKGQ